MATTPRPYHVVVWGASGFTGRLVAEHLSRDYKGGEVKWALAGRSREKLEAIRTELSGTYGPEVRDIPIITADLNDQASLDAMVSSTKVVISTAGPFIKLGTPIVDAAVRNGSHYVDITGEAPWVRQMIEKHHEEAAKKRVRIVPCCGYDSIPSDLGALLVVRHLRDKLGKKTAKVLSAVVSSKGGVSGGTIASGMEIAQEVRANPQLSEGGPYSLVPPAQRTPAMKDQDFWGVRWSAALKAYLAPFVMQVINARVVHRSAHLLGWGDGFSYQEVISTKSWLLARAIQLGTVAFGAALALPIFHPLLRRLLPAPGEGPTRESMLGGHYKHAVLGWSVEEGGAAPTLVRAELGDKHRDGGYWGTSRMLLEAGLCLALEEKALMAPPGAGGGRQLAIPVPNDAVVLDADPDCKKGGLLTPASAMGTHLIERLRRAGVTYEVKGEETPAPV